MKVVYISGPLSAPTRDMTQKKVDQAKAIAWEVQKKGYAFELPHLMFYLDEHWAAMGLTVDYEFWMRQCMAKLDKCDMLVHYACSPGADREKARAEEKGMKVYESADDLPEVTK